MLGLSGSYLRSTRPLAPVTLVLLLEPEGSVPADGGLEGVRMGRGFFSARFFWDATLLFSLKVDDLLSPASSQLRSTRRPLLMMSR
ncbi:hypothetical protein EYF80_050167 [Liparis tanakae]|uniref:Uncharacterized protein n=1 Tax=Liparis tanakae TaxID=230148 RepID=A0A4Z2FFZ2_9TELE|nr:hypothetical protein EYF80_050167 [Liparis tanakae]